MFPSYNFLITGIDYVMFVDKDKHPEVLSHFGRNLGSNELIFHFSGDSTVYFNDQVLATIPGTVRFLPKGPNSRYDVRRNEPGTCIDILFQTDRPIAPDALILHKPGNKQLETLFQKIFTTWVGKGEGYYFDCISLLYKILAELQKQTYLPQEQFARISPAIDYIQEHFLEETINTENLASLCHISYSYFKKLFTRRFGMPPKKYIIQLKINYACDLLRTDRYTITLIGEMCGFKDIYFFSRQFKEYTGLSPKEYQKQWKA